MKYSEDGARYRDNHGDTSEHASPVILALTKAIREQYGYPHMEAKIAVCNAKGDARKALQLLKEYFDR